MHRGKNYSLCNIHDVLARAGIPIRDFYTKKNIDLN